ncbi:hypothetical protein HPB51_022959 [Rhipicephalus microplus]|uniref:Uncharacterized protein n=1 Tax=Rhipicephalus microplus TaxID=6941 RepID=A0A9J6DCY8_RHIMP|nr:hypothetical protein HPB51_022959 [Rhipicephalus microplus]
MCHGPDGYDCSKGFSWRLERTSYPHPIAEPSCCTVLGRKDSAFSTRFHLVRRKPRQRRVLHPVSRPHQMPPLESSAPLHLLERKT